MIQFQYKREKNNILISLKTDSTQYGTFHRIATIIYALKLDILSGELGTIEENGTQFTVDSFILQAEDNNTTQAAFQLGVMMDSLFSQNAKFEEILEKLQIPEPAIGTFSKKIRNSFLRISRKKTKLVCIWNQVQDEDFCIMFPEF